MITLAIDTANDELGIALMEEQHIIGELITTSKQNHAVKLMPAIVDLMQRTEINQSDLSSIVVTQGPGSYTGSRVGLTTAKTMAWGLNIPLFTVSSLALLAMNGRLTSDYICPFYNARRGAVFTGLYKWENNQLIEVQQETNIAMEDWLNDLVSLERQILFLSPHMDVFESMIIDTLSDQGIITDIPLRRPFPSNMHIMMNWLEEIEPHVVTPNYLRKTEAETKLLNEKKDV